MAAARFESGMFENWTRVLDVKTNAVAEQKHEKDHSPAEPVTTLMLANIPCRVTHQSLAAAIDDLGFYRRYDFLRVVTGGKGGVNAKSNLGYGFVNFRSPDDAKAFAKVFNGYIFEGIESTKRGMARPARTQGLLKTLDMLRPMDAEKGVRGSFTCTL